MRRLMIRGARHLARLCFAAGWLPLAAPAAEAPVRVPPWYGHSAVLAPGLCSARDNVLVAGQVETGCRFTGGFVVLPDRTSKLPASRSESRARWSDWSLRYDPNFSKDDCQALAAAPTFDTRLEFRGTGIKSETPLVLTNQTMGPVWVLYVNPDIDTHELPPLSELARTRVRVLSLTNGFDGSRGGRWVPASEAEAGGDTLFCGLPRGFANRLASTESRRFMGLILVPSWSLTQKTGTPLNQIALAHQGGREAERADFQAGLLAALDVTSDSAPDGYEARRRTFEAANQREIERDRELGMVRERAAPRHRWTQISNRLDGLSIRVTGRVW